MDGTFEGFAEKPALARHAETLSRPMTQARHMADAIRALAIDATERSKFGHPGLPMAMADVATALWTRYLKFDAADPSWPDRDRFVLSAGHGSMLLYALTYLTGYDGMSIDDIRDFRQLPSEHPAIETTTGPLGQGLATAVGMAIAERNMAARFGKSLVDHRTWVVASDDDMMEGISHEASALAGHLGLSKLTVLYDDNRVSIDGEASPALLGRRGETFRHLWLGDQEGRWSRSEHDPCSFVLRRPVQEADVDRLPHHHRPCPDQRRNQRLSARAKRSRRSQEAARLAQPSLRDAP